MSSLAPVVIITGTDTEIGKTFVGAALAHELASRPNTKVCAIKPAESGCPQETPTDAEDGVTLAKATGQAHPQAALVRLRTPVAPPLAADKEGVFLDAKLWFKVIEEARREADWVFVEGAGGLLSPLTWEHTILDIAQTCGASAILVSSDRLGTVNHTRLTQMCLSQHKVPLCGVVFNAPPQPDTSTGANASTFARYAKDTPIIEVPRLPHWREASPLMASLCDHLINTSG